MIKIIKSYHKISISVVIIFSLFSCQKYCYTKQELEDLNNFSKYVKQWQPNETNTTYKIMTDSYGFSQTLIKNKTITNEIIDAFEDDCGKTYPNYDINIHFKTSLSPFDCDIVFLGGDNLKKSFKMKMSITYNDIEKNFDYNLYTKKLTEGNAVVNLLNQYNVSGIIYDDVMEIIFLSPADDKDIEKLYYAKGVGIIKFVEKNGNNWSVEMR